MALKHKGFKPNNQMKTVSRKGKGYWAVKIGKKGNFGSKTYIRKLHRYVDKRSGILKRYVVVDGKRYYKPVEPNEQAPRDEQIF